ncbi:MAG: RNA polymerase factor sigma-54, partial [Campylobacter sp.]|nr:RNA polymerase factor sigma-54 [Campylobacter sp.]
MKLSQKLTAKTKLNQTLRSWLPILQVASDELKETLEPFIEKNPFVQLEPNPKSRSLNFYSDIYKTSISDTIESSIIYKESLYEKLSSQIDDKLFPSKKSKEIANLIIECI